jgi:hypothetical protein
MEELMALSWVVSCGLDGDFDNDDNNLIQNGSNGKKTVTNNSAILIKNDNTCNVVELLNIATKPIQLTPSVTPHSTTTTLSKVHTESTPQTTTMMSASHQSRTNQHTASVPQPQQPVQHPFKETCFGHTRPPHKQTKFQNCHSSPRFAQMSLSKHKQDQFEQHYQAPAGNPVYKPSSRFGNTNQPCSLSQTGKLSSHQYEQQAFLQNQQSSLQNRSQFSNKTTNTDNNIRQFTIDPNNTIQLSNNHLPPLPPTPQAQEMHRSSPPSPPTTATTQLSTLQALSSSQTNNNNNTSTNHTTTQLKSSGIN